MKRSLSITSAVLASATAASAHPGAHVHPHEGAHWLVMVAALAVLAAAGGLAAVRARSRK